MTENTLPNSRDLGSLNDLPTKDDLEGDFPHSWATWINRADVRVWLTKTLDQLDRETFDLANEGEITQKEQSFLIDTVATIRRRLLGDNSDEGGENG